MTAECPHGLGDPAWCSACKDGPKVEHVPRPTETIIEARYSAQECKTCGRAITVGEDVRRWSDGSWRHPDCHEAPVA